jgi:hypothetical protein
MESVAIKGSETRHLEQLLDTPRTTMSSEKLRSGHSQGTALPDTSHDEARAFDLTHPNNEIDSRRG